ncbi:hypothetical protein ACA910_018782 [Epithemia clementina (nom. ined.)]
MSAKVGGRLFQPALPVIDGASPTLLEQGFQQTLQEFAASDIPLESKEGIETRERVLNQMGQLCREWIRYVGLKKGLPRDVVESAGGQLFTSGSYRLGVHEPGADIDTILVAPGVVRREDFFGTAYVPPGDSNTNENEGPQRDPNSLAERIRAHPDVTNFVPVEGAAVPILTFDWEGINIDLLFARLNSNTVPSDFDIDNDAVLDGVDSATEKSINGPRVTNLVAAFVNGTPQRYQTFLTVVRCVRKWAKARGLYSNKMGYWGGVNINIAVAQCLQLYPNACPASLLRKFFLVFKTWRWPQPVMLTKPHDAGYGLPLWSAQTSVRQVAPMITPAYPAMNSTLSVSRQTLQILQEEFIRGHEIVDGLWKQYQQDPSPENILNWNVLFQSSDFFIAYPNYLSLCIVGPSQLEAQAWAGFVESRLRKLVSDQLARSLPLKKIQLWPKKLEACVADQGALLTAAQRQNSITYFVGFYVDKIRMRGDHLNIEIALQNFRDWDLSRYQPLLPGMDVLAKHFKVKELPLICFQDTYEGGKQEAMKKRRQLKANNPVRQEKKRLQRLNELKAKMAEIQKKKEEQQQEEQDRKRKRDDLEDATANLIEDTDGTAIVKEEETENSNEATNKNESGAAAEPNDETNLLESALDTVNEKTKEEADADRQKLLAGELIAEGAGGIGEDDEESDEEDLMYAGDDARSSFFTKVPKKKKRKLTTKSQDDMDGDDERHGDGADDTDTNLPKTTTMSYDKRSLPVSEERAEFLKQIGCHFVNDTEAHVLGADLLPPWQIDDGTEEDEEEDNAKKTKSINLADIKYASIKFATPFDIVELDAHGHVIDKGDDDFSPSKTWAGRRAGFEFKLGERGLGYYRTGKKVVVPSNRAY